MVDKNFYLYGHDYITSNLPEVVYLRSDFNHDIAFARGGVHLSIAHALRLPETKIISWGGDFMGVWGFFWGRGFF